MALLIMILRKMIKNKWLELSLLFGLVLTVALTSSLPIYTNAILHRLLIKELQNLQINTNQYPGTYWLSAGLSSNKPQDSDVMAADEYLRNAGGKFGIPVQYFVRERVTDKYSFAPANTEKVDIDNMVWADFTAISDIERQVRLADGRLPAKEPVDGVYEALVVPEALTQFKMVLGSVFTIRDDNVKETIRVKPVGVIEPNDYSDLYWYNHPGSYKNSFLLDFDLFNKEFVQGGKLPVKSGYWYFALDYSKMTLSSISGFLGADRMIGKYMNEKFDGTGSNVPALNTLGVYFQKEAKLRILLWSLHVPIMLMLAFYLYMVANLITERQKTEIAVLRSRGASRWQIIASYAAEGSVLGAIAFASGPYLGVLLTKMLGASSGFLEFVQRAKVEAAVNREAFEYALIAVVFSLLMTLIPVFLATRVTIVGRKQQMARLQKLSFWHKYFFDVILIAIALYGLQNYQSRVKNMLSFGFSSADIRIDPLLFLIPSFFILGAALFLLRWYPLFIRIVHRLGRRWWTPSLSSALIQIGRSSSQYQFIMVFMIVTIATGIFGASANRTINKNVEDKIYYDIGTDIRMQIYWENDAPPVILAGASDEEGQGGREEAAMPAVPKRTQYSEPSFLPFTQIPGVSHASKVFLKDEAVLYEGDSVKDEVQLMGIETYDFGQTAWMRSRLLDHPFNGYLNLIASNSSAVLVSKSMAAENNIKPGDTISLGWSGTDKVDFIVYAVIDYWPSWNPAPDDLSLINGDSEKVKRPKLVVGNLPYIQNNLALEPYEVWLKLKPEASSQEVYDAVSDKGYDVLSVKNARQELIKSINDPFILAINGVMTLDFIISIFITFVGFLLYWIISLHARTLQFGIFRAMGISFPKLIAMLVGEQILISAASIVIGIYTGNITSRLFVPLFEMSFDAKTQILPFKVTFDQDDYLSLYMIVTAMLAVGLIILGYVVSRIKIHQAVKLGED